MSPQNNKSEDTQVLITTQDSEHSSELVRVTGLYTSEPSCYNQKAIYMGAHNQANTEETITKVWKNGRIHPLNPHIFSDQDFAPSMATLTEVHVPPSYPVNHSDLHLYNSILPSCHSDTATIDNEPNSGARSGNDEDQSQLSESESDDSAESDGPRGDAESLGSSSESSKENNGSETLTLQSYCLRVTLIIIVTQVSDASRALCAAGKSQALESEVLTAKAYCALALSEVNLECDVQDTAREAKAKKKAEVVAQNGSDVHFNGALSTKGKEDLIDVANQLKIKTTGIKLDLLKAIRAHFDAHTELKSDA
ncbi:hypothetical protein BDN67DRAFT_984895 [Paxillus ammoniavirescens]|nr:hypothetical protein BDN67DRAFT_984895 [Paxillus ammoniavirescens]